MTAAYSNNSAAGLSVILMLGSAVVEECRSLSLFRIAIPHPPRILLP